LLGSAATASVSRALQAGVNAATGTDNSVLNADQRQAVKLLADIIIPTTDTPGAVEAGVPAFIESIVTDWYTDIERGIFLDGLKALDQYCQANGETRFTAASAQTRIAALREQEAIASEHTPPARTSMSFAPVDDQQAPFFTKIKELVVLGYYTSQVGATQELAYQPMVHEFDGAYDFNEVGRQWSH
jgi:hypothetical protein